MKMNMTTRITKAGLLVPTIRAVVELDRPLEEASILPDIVSQL
jgi:hypothetical protein